MKDEGDVLPCTLLSLTAVSYIVCVCVGGRLDEGMGHCRIRYCL